MTQSIDRTTPRAWWILGLLSFTYLFSFIDRFAVSLLVEPIRMDLGLSDVQLGALQGLAFALFYAIAGLPLGRIADLHNRKYLIIGGLLIWSMATALSGLAQGFAALFLLRALVGIGEASLTPSAVSMFGDVFAKRDVGRAIGVYTAGAIAGGGLALIIGGAVYSMLSNIDPLVLPFVGELSAWRATFIFLGAPGLLLALLILLSVREPQRRGYVDIVSISEVAKYIIANRSTYGALFLLYVLSSGIGYAITGWTPAYLARELGMDTAQAGFTFGMVMLVFGIGGPVAGGWFNDRLSRLGGSYGSIVSAAPFYGLVIVGAGLAYLQTDTRIVLFGLSLAAFGFTGSFAVPMTEIVRATPARMRGVASALNLMIAALFGMSVGPLVVPLLS
ncbi:MAG: MFS transporter, partial [Pseudomonadota bacterium]